MDVGTNKTRKDTRAVVSLVARYRSPSTFEYVEEACCDVSLGGMFIRSKDPAAAGTLLKLECESGVGDQIRGVARVVWLRAQQNEYGPSGMGVKFVKLDPESRDVITRIVQELAEAGIESPSMSSAPEQRGKPPVKRATSSTPAAAEPPASPPPPKAAEISPTLPLRGHAPKNDVAVLHRASDRAAATPPPPPSSSKPPVPGASRPAPSNALLARANVEPLEVEPVPSLGASLSVSPPVPEAGRDLAPLQAMVRARVSSAPPPEERSGRAFWLVAGAVVALGAIVALLSMRAAREDAQEEVQAHADAPPVVPTPAPTSMNQAVPAPSEPAAAEAPSDLHAELAAEQAEPAPAPADPLADPAQVAAAEPGAAPSNADQAAVASPESQQTPQTAQPEATTAAPAPSKPAPNPAQPSETSASASTPPPPAARPIAPPVLRIVPADPAPTDQPEAQPQAAASSSPAPAQTPSAPAATSGSSPAADAQPAANKVAPPPLPPGEIARVILFTSRPSGATVYVGEQSVVTPGELNLGAMPPRIRVTAQKEGYEPSTVWLNNVAEFQKVGNVMRREAHFVLKALPAGAVTPGQPGPVSTTAPGASSPAAPAQVPTAAPSQP